MSVLTPHAFRGLLQPHAPPCVSLYQPTHRHHPDNGQDAIRFKNLLREVESSRRQRSAGADDLLGPFRALGGCGVLNHTLDGLAVLGADVGPFSRQSALEKGGFGGPLFLTSGDVFVRCQVPERAVRSALIVVDAPGFDLGLRVVDRGELVDVQARVRVPSLNSLTTSASRTTDVRKRVRLMAAAGRLRSLPAVLLRESSIPPRR